MALAVHEPIVVFSDDLNIQPGLAFYTPFIIWPAIGLVFNCRYKKKSAAKPSGESRLLHVDAKIRRLLAPNDEPITEDPPIISARDQLREKWELSGVVQWEGSSVLILSDRYDHTTRKISKDAGLDGWTGRDSGSDYAVFAQNGEEVRFVLHEAVDD